MPVNAPPADKRFRRSHVRPTSRRDSWRGRVLRGLAVAGLVVLFASVVYRRGRLCGHFEQPHHSTHRRQRQSAVVERTGAGAAGAPDRLQHGRGRHRAGAPADSRTRSGWTRVEIRRVFPASVSVVLTEKQAIALGRINGSLFLIDRTAMIIDEYGPNYAEFDLPIVDGLGSEQGTDDARGRAARDDARAVSRLAAVAPGPCQRVSEIDLRDPDERRWWCSKATPPPCVSARKSSSSGWSRTSSWHRRSEIVCRTSTTWMCVTFRAWWSDRDAGSGVAEKRIVMGNRAATAVRRTPRGT